MIRIGSANVESTDLDNIPSIYSQLAQHVIPTTMDDF